MNPIRCGAAALLLFSLAGCGNSNPTVPGALIATGSVNGLAVQLQGRNAHPYFPIAPGTYKDYRITLAGVEEPRWIRVTVGAPETFFGRSATPLVYSAIPGQVPDSVIVGLYQYFSISPAGDLWFHGAQNGIVRAHSDPPVRNLLAHPRPGEAWADTVHFESFIGSSVFNDSDYLFTWTLSEEARLALPAGTVRAVRATSVIYDAPSTSLRVASAVAVSHLGVILRPGPVDVLKGFWFARHEGIVARDWPFGEGAENTNIETFELVREGFGPVPPPFVPPPPGGTQ
jgi:hypothetical protein